MAARVWALIGQAQAAITSATDSVPAIRARRMRALFAAVGEQPLDLVIVPHDFLWPSEVSELKRSTGAVDIPSQDLLPVPPLRGLLRQLVCTGVAAWQVKRQIP